MLDRHAVQVVGATARQDFGNEEQRNPARSLGRAGGAGEDQMEDVETAEDSSKSTDTTAGDRDDGTGTGDKGEDKEVPKQPEDSTAGEQAEATSDTTMPIRKRKSAADEEEHRKKSMKNEEEQRVFVGEKDDPPTKEEKKGPVEPVVIPTELKLPPTTEK